MTKFDNTFGGNKMTDILSAEEERYVQSMAPTYGFPYVNLRGYTINPEALSEIPEAQARLGNLVAFDSKQRTLYIAVKKPSDPTTKTILEGIMQKRPIQIYMCSTTSLEHAFKRYKDVVNTTVEKRGVLEISPEDILRMKEEIKVGHYGAHLCWSTRFACI